MTFEMNNELWQILEISNAEMNIMFGSDLVDTFTHGITRYTENIIYLNKDTPQKKKTLYHELTHCFLHEYGHNQHGKAFDNEDVCEISACSHDIIHRIVEDYFKGDKENANK